MTQKIYLTGITTTGTPHIGNYVGAIRPSIKASKDPEKKNYYFLADFHALAKNEDPDKIGQSTLEIAASWLALGLDTEHACLDKRFEVLCVSRNQTSIEAHIAPALVLRSRQLGPQR